MAIHDAAPERGPRGAVRPGRALSAYVTGRALRTDGTGRARRSRRTGNALRTRRARISLWALLIPLEGDLALVARLAGVDYAQRAALLNVAGVDRSIGADDRRGSDPGGSGEDRRQHQRGAGRDA